MAEMIPDRLPPNASNGEKTVFQLLQNLPDDCLVYYEPIIEQRYPDFIVILPRLGILVIEVKGWRANHIQQGDHTDITIFTSQSEKHIHPMRQARLYMYGLMDKCKNSSIAKPLINTSKNDYEGKFIFPFGNAVILNNIAKQDLKTHKNGDFTTIFSDANTVYKDQLKQLASLSSKALEDKLKDFFDPWWKFSVLKEKQINAIRAIIHPEITVSALSQNEAQPTALSSQENPLKVLDLQQENNVRNIGDGHRLIRGVAGSGKTILLIARAKLLSQREDKPEILVLCYNVTLAHYFKTAFTDYPNIKALHFDGWAKSLDTVRKKDEQNDELGDRLLQRLIDGCPDTARYKAIMVDEAQDFSPYWFSCVVEALADGENGDLLIVGDNNQKVFKNQNKERIIWKDLGVNVIGGRSTKLQKNYRNTQKILDLAAVFSNQAKPKPQETNNAEGGLETVQVDVSQCLRKGDFKPIFIQAQSRQEEIGFIVTKIKALLKDQLWAGSKIPALAAKDIGILYRHANSSNRPYLDSLLTQLREFTEVVWLNESSESRKKVSEAGIKVQTVHSAKGLQYAAVFLIWADLFPASFAPDEEEEERNLFYVALTRPEDYLMITSTGTSAFTEMVQSKLS